MELINTTRMAAGFTMGLDPDGRELLVVVVKGTFTLPRSGEEARPAEAQLPLCVADTFTGEPGFSAPLQEVDFAARKPACDVLLVGHARAPGGRPVQRLRVGLSVGPMHKTFDVVGDRQWRARLSGIDASEPAPFTAMPVSYDRAFGGADRAHEDEREHDVHPVNPVGRGWRKHLKHAWVDGAALPNTEEAGRPVASPADTARPMSLGPLGRGWAPRARHAGTYDARWLADDFPFLPRDFDPRYFQAAPEDQQLPIGAGPLPVVLSGFTADGERRFTLPSLQVGVQVYPRRGGQEEHTAQLDTISFEPDHERFSLAWRLTRPLPRGLLDVAQVRVACA